MRYDLGRLGPHEFEHMSQALTIAVLGSAVSVFGDGPDGGREATFEGRLEFPVPVPAAGPWEGYGLVQAKFKQRTTNTGDDTQWLLTELQKELRTWDDRDSGRRRRGRLPRYLVITTNVTLSPDPERGGIDKADALIRHWSRKLGLRGWQVWHHDQICRYLDVHDGVRRTYGGLITAGDVLQDVQRALRDLRPDEVHDEPLGLLLTKRAAKELIAQQWVRLSDAGHRGNQKLQLSAVAVDLPSRPRGDDSRARVAGTVAEVVRAGDMIRRPRPGIPLPPHIALVGGPGQGKTTLGQLLCQVYRVAILDQRPRHTLGHEIPDLLAAYRVHLGALDLAAPQCLRWPVRVVLSEFADELADAPSTTLLQHVARQTRAESPINPRMMRAWLREWPWLLVLDGLDEVADPDAREQVLKALSDFYIEAGEADLLVVATTRPQGYQDELAAKYYNHFVLEPMGTGEALAYARHLARVRFVDDPEMHDRVLTRLRGAARDAQTARLMRTPLQVTIMSILLEGRSRAPRDRYRLFEAYYDTLFDREINKPDSSMSRLLEQHRRDIDAVHEQVGWILQARAQHAGEAEARMPTSEIREIISTRLLAAEYAPAAADRLAAELARAATDRLVMLVGYENDMAGFEVRSLQEVMAARSLFVVDDSELVDGLQVLAPAAHWRNTWLFAVSRLFTERERVRDALLLSLRAMDDTTPLTVRLKPGARLAMEILDEDVTAIQPRERRLLLTHALDLLDTALPGPTMTALARVTHDAITQDVSLTHKTKSVVDSKLDGSFRDRIAALDFLAAWSDIPGEAAVPARSRMQRWTVGTPAPHMESALAALRTAPPRPRWARADRTTTDDASEPASLTARQGQWLDTFGDGSSAHELVSIVRGMEHGVHPLAGLDAPPVVELLTVELARLDGSDWQLAAHIDQRLVNRLSRAIISDADLRDIRPMAMPPPPDAGH